MPLHLVYVVFRDFTKYNIEVRNGGQSEDRLIGEEIRRRRQEKGWTGVQLAEKAGMAPSAISQIETGRRSPHSASVIKLAAALECEVAELYPKAPQAPLPLDLEAHPPGTAYFVEPEEGEEPDVVTLRLYVWRELEKDDALLQKVAQLLRDRDNAKAGAG